MRTFEKKQEGGEGTGIPSRRGSRDKDTDMGVSQASLRTGDEARGCRVGGEWGPDAAGPAGDHRDFVLKRVGAVDGAGGTLAAPQGVNGQSPVRKH